MLNLTPFQFGMSNIRVIVTETGEIHFVASDVAKCLGYNEPHKAVSSHCKHAKSLTDIDGINHPVQQSQKLDPKTKLIQECDVYRLVMRSKLESAERFQDWIVEEVIPSIRKTGQYGASQKFPVPQTYSEALRLAADYVERNAALEQKIEENAPKVRFAEIVGEDSNTRCVRAWVKAMKHENNLRVGEREVFKWLVDNKYIYKDNGGYLPYARYEANGANYFTVVIDEINGKPRKQLKITGKGVVALTAKVVRAFSQPDNGMVKLAGGVA